jgi:opacity protein-like surface antigen
MRKLVMMMAMVAAAASPLHAQDAFDTRFIRGEGTVLSLSAISGDWLVHSGFTQQLYGAELERGMLGARFAFGNVQGAGEQHTALAGGLDFAVRLPGIPVNLTVAGEYSQAEVGDATIRRVAAPVTLSNAAVLVFDGFWLHPVLAFGGVAHRTEIVETTTGVMKYAAAGLEVGRGPVSVRGQLQHNVSSPQQANMALRFRF